MHDITENECMCIVNVYSIFIANIPSVIGCPSAKRSLEASVGPYGLLGFIGKVMDYTQICLLYMY